MPDINTMRIPPRYEPPLGELATFTQKSYAGLIASLEQAPTTTSPGDLERTIARAVPTWTASQVEGLIGALFALANLHNTHDWTITQIAERVAEINSGIPPQKRKAFVDRLTRLLEIDAIMALSKAVDLASEYPNVLHTARVVTDIRPIFGDELSVDPLGALLTHTLHIDYYTRGRIEAFYVALTEGEVRILKDTADRALEKAANLQGFMNRTGLTTYGTDSE